MPRLGPWGHGRGKNDRKERNLRDDIGSELFSGFGFGSFGRSLLRKKLI